MAKKPKLKIPLEQYMRNTEYEINHLKQQLAEIKEDRDCLQKKLKSTEDFHDGYENAMHLVFGREWHP